jgi:predicted ester cyclase
MADFPAPRGDSPSTTEDPISCVRAYERLWRTDAPDAAVDELLAPGFVAHTPAEKDTGREEFKQHRRMALGALSDLEARFEPVVANGSRVAAHATIAGTHAGEFFGVAPTGKRLSWREVHVFDARDRQIVEHWMDAALLSAYMQMIGQGEPDGEPPRTVPSGVERQLTPRDQLAPITGYMDMVATHDASTVRRWATDDYLQHGPFGANVTRDEFEAGNRDIVWRALPDISIQLEPLLADGELVAARGLGQATHTGSSLFGVPASGKSVSFTETHIYRMRGTRVCEHWLQVDLLGLLGQLKS